MQRQVAALGQEEATARTGYTAAARAVADAEARVTRAAAAAATAEAKFLRVRAAIGELIASTYRTGGTNPLLRLLLADDPDALLRSADWVEQNAQYQADALLRVVAVRRDLERDRQASQEELARLTAARAVVATRQKAVAAKVAEVRALLDSLRAQDRQRLEAKGKAGTSANDAGSPPAPLPPAAPAAGGACAPSGSRGAEARLTSATLQIMRCGLAAFPQIQHAGGWGTRGNATDHDDGRAVDFMLPDYSSAAGNDLGWAVAEWAIRQPHVKYVIFDQMQYGSWNHQWRPMSDRGSDTANHRDHVHVSTSA